MKKETCEAKIKAMLLIILKDKGVGRKEIGNSESLYEDGVGLDSLDAATFSVMLEHEFGSEPYSKGGFPRTLGDVVAFYSKDS